MTEVRNEVGGCKYTTCEKGRNLTWRGSSDEVRVAPEKQVPGKAYDIFVAVSCSPVSNHDMLVQPSLMPVLDGYACKA